MTVTAVVLHRFVENPIRRSRQLAHDRIAVLLLLLVCVAASSAAAGVA
jgi:peptidoglycan/LPS O-acetylase OafA/YrhL